MAEEIKQLANLAKELQKTDPIDFSLLNVGEDEAFEMMAKNVIEQFEAITNKEEAEVVALATITKLLVENFALKIKTQVVK